MKKLIIAAIVAASLTACASKDRIIREAYPLPTPYVPKAPDTTRPDIDLNKFDLTRPLDSYSSEERGQIVQSLYISAVQWKAYALEQEQIVDEYRRAGTVAGEVNALLLQEIDRINKQAGDTLRGIKIEQNIREEQRR